MIFIIGSLFALGLYVEEWISFLKEKDDMSVLKFIFSILILAGVVAFWPVAIGFFIADRWRVPK